MPPGGRFPWVPLRSSSASAAARASARCRPRPRRGGIYFQVSIRSRWPRRASAERTSPPSVTETRSGRPDISDGRRPSRPSWMSHRKRRLVAFTRNPIASTVSRRRPVKPVRPNVGTAIGSLSASVLPGLQHRLRELRRGDASTSPDALEVRVETSLVATSIGSGMPETRELPPRLRRLSTAGHYSRAPIAPATPSCATRPPPFPYPRGTPPMPAPPFRILCPRCAACCADESNAR